MKDVWKNYYNALMTVYGYLERSEILFQTGRVTADNGLIGKNYRAIYQLTDPQQLIDVEYHLKNAEKAYATAVESEKYKLPMTFPKIIRDKSLVKIQIHINKAHQSTNFSGNETLDIAMIRRSDDEDEEKISLELLNEIVAKLKIRKITAKIAIDDTEKFHVIRVKASVLAKLYTCDSIQQRVATGRQIRANYFTMNENRQIERSTLKSIGVLVLPPDHPHIDVVHSHDRKIRDDAIFTPNHPKEILLEEIPEIYRNGRIYKQYDKKKQP